MTSDLFVSEDEREARGCEYVAQGWRASADQARRDGFPEAADRYDVHAKRWEAMADAHRAKVPK
jgi:hypothetical protein